MNRCTMPAITMGRQHIIGISPEGPYFQARGGAPYERVQRVRKTDPKLSRLRVHVLQAADACLFQLGCCLGLRAVAAWTWFHLYHAESTISAVSMWRDLTHELRCMHLNDGH